MDAKIDERAVRSPTAWMCVLEGALERGDLRKAARAQQRLRDLGVSVEGWLRLGKGAPVQPAKGGAR